MRLFSVAFAAWALLALSGCALQSTSSPVAQAGPAVSGSFHGGQQPLIGTHVYLMAAATSGYGAASQSLLTSGDGTDSVGTFVLTNSLGEFTFTSYSCTQNTQVYLLGLQGNPSTGNNSAIGLMAALGNCPSSLNFNSITNIEVNELTTVAAAYALAGFAGDATHISSSGTTLAQQGIMSAFAGAANLVSIRTGGVLETTPAGNGAVPYTEINTLANIIATCVNSSDSNGIISSNCSSLFALTKSGGTSGITPSDTATALINIAHNPWANVASIYPMPPPASPYAPVLSAQPRDWTLYITFEVGGSYNSAGIAVDSSGNIWIANTNPDNVTELSPVGAILNIYTGFSGPYGVAVDPSNHVWITNQTNKTVSQISNSSVTTYTPAILTPQNIAIDANGSIWATNVADLYVYKLNPSGTLAGSYFVDVQQATIPNGIAIDGSGTAWIGNNNTSYYITAISSAGTISHPDTGYQNGPQQYGVAVDASNNIWVGTGGYLLRYNSATATGTKFGSVFNCIGVAIDGTGQIWVGGSGASRLYQFSNSGATIGSGYTASSPGYVAVDGSGNVWVSSMDGAAAFEYLGIASPVVTPISTGVKTGMLGTRP